MRCANRAALIINLFMLALLTVATANAKPMPDIAQPQLKQILEAPEFQPREVSKPLLSELQERFGKLFIKTVHNVFDWLRKVTENTELNPAFVKFIKRLFDWLESALLFLRDIFDLAVKFVLLAAVCVLAYLGFKKLRKTKRPQAKVPLPSTAARAIQKVYDPDELARSGNWALLITELRRRLRAEFYSRYTIRHSVTDRELAAGVPNSEKRRSLFGEVVSIFEQVAFASMPVDVDKVKDIFGRYKGAPPTA